jgi:hypothetical protein
MYKISAELAAKLKGKEFVKDNKFNPVEDKDGVWYISDEEFDKADIAQAKEDLKAIDISKDKVTVEDYKL